MRGGTPEPRGKLSITAQRGGVSFILEMAFQNLEHNKRGNMTKREFIKTIARDCHITEKQTREILNIMIQNITEAIKTGDAVTIDGFGKFYAASYKGRDLQTPQGKTLKTADGLTPKFKPSKKLKEIIKTV